MLTTFGTSYSGREAEDCVLVVAVSETSSIFGMLTRRLRSKDIILIKGITSAALPAGLLSGRSLNTERSRLSFKSPLEDILPILSPSQADQQ